MTPTTRGSVRLAALALGLSVGATACGGSSGGAATVAPSTTASASGAPSASPTSGLPQALQGMQVDDKGSKNVAGMDEVKVKMDDFYFQPTVLVGTPGQKITVELDNEGSASHTFSLKGQGIDKVVQPGESAKVSVTFPSRGSVAFECRFHTGQGMRGALAVQ